MSLLFILVLPVAARAQLANIQYTTTGDGSGNVIITGFSATGSGPLAIPGTINNSTVTGIGANAFESKNLTSVTIPSSVTNIGDDAFGFCNLLTSITVAVGNSAYSSVNGVLFNLDQTTLIQYPAGEAGSYTIPSGATSIENYAFNGCTNLTGIVIPNTVTAIGDDAFNDCSSLTSVIIPNSVTSMGNLAFEQCTKLASVTLSSNLTGIGAYAFSGCPSLSTLNIPSSVTSIGQGAFDNDTVLNSMTIPASVTSIGDEAFQNCSSLSSVTVSNGVTSIGELAFTSTALQTVTIPSSVTSIGLFAFGGCPALTSIVVSPTNSSYSSLNGVLFNNNQSTLISYPDAGPSSYTIPNTVTSIANSAFAGCMGLTSVIFPNSLTSIGQSAFQACNLLGSVTIPSGVNAIGDDAFLLCTSLTSITVAPTNFSYSSLDGVLFNNNQTTLIAYPGAKTGSYIIPNSVTSIGEGAFYKCVNLTGVTIPSSVTTIGDNAFNWCPNLSSVVFQGNAPSTGASIFGSEASNFTVYYVGGAKGFASPLWIDSWGDEFPSAVLTVSTFSQWEGQTNFFTAQQQDTAEISGPTAMPQNDGVPNLLKYLFDINPAQPMSATDRAALQVVSMTKGGNLTLTYRQNNLQTGITINVQTSPDLQNWTTLTQSPTLSSTTYTIQQTGTDETTQDPIMQVQVLPNGSASQFIRLNVTQP